MWWRVSWKKDNVVEDFFLSMVKSWRIIFPWFVSLTNKLHITAIEICQDNVTCKPHSFGSVTGTRGGFNRLELGWIIGWNWVRWRMEDGWILGRTLS